MADIREIEYSESDTVMPLVEEFLQNLDEHVRPSSGFKELLVDAWAEGDVSVLGAFAKDKLLGIILLGLRTNRFSLIQVSNTLDISQVKQIEKDLFIAGFDRLKERESWVTGGLASWLTTNLVECALEAGFRRYDKLEMIAKRETLETLEVPEVRSGYALQTYDDDLKKQVADLVFECFQDSPDVKAEPHELSSPEKCLHAVSDTIDGGVGDFKDGRYSWVLMKDNEMIGLDFNTLKSDSNALIPFLCLKQSYRGKGLGKLLLIHSLRDLLKKDPKVTEVTLYTLSTNPARHLYSSVGFKEVNRHTIYVWNRE